MTQEHAVADPIGLITDMVAAVERQLPAESARVAVAGVAGGRSKARRLASFLTEHPGILTDGRSPAPRAAGDLLIALRRAGAQAISAPRCAECGKPLSTLQRRGQDWYCSVCGPQPASCAACGNIRRIRTRDRAGLPRCAMCPDDDARDPIEVIGAVLTALDPTIDYEAVGDAVRRSAPRFAHRQKLAWALESNPALLTGEGHLAPRRAILTLIDQLRSAGVAGIVLPACPRCHRVVRIDKPLDGQRVCRTCIAHARTERCVGCGAEREPATRDDQGRPLCPNCLVTAPENLERCINCGRRRLVNIRTPDGPLCPNCPVLSPATCSICGQKGLCGTSRATGRPWCPQCQRRTAACSACSREAEICSGTLAEPLCADCTPPPIWRECPTCSDPDHPHPGRCARCLINKRLDELMGPADALPAGLGALRRNIATTEHPITAMRWLTKKSIAPALADLAAGRLPLTHQGLDALPGSQPLAHLRQVLIGVGALPERDEHMARLERFLADRLASQNDLDRRALLHRYAIWHLTRRLRQRSGSTPITAQQAASVRNHVRAAVAFLQWLAAHDLTLDTCRQADFEHWLTDDAASYRKTAGHFIRWARTNKLTSINASAIRWHGPTGPLDEEHRWETARRLVHDEKIDPEDRLAGLLLLLYAQTPAAICRMTLEHITADTKGQISIRLGPAPIVLPEPVAALVRTVTADRKGHATIGALTPSVWLFPGGQPGRPISTGRLTQRLNNLGIHPNQARSTALFQLATEIPAAILARTLGIHTDVAVTWQRLSAGDWATYAAEVTRRTSTVPELS
jgi:hypothetical protein